MSSQLLARYYAAATTKTMAQHHRRSIVSRTRIRYLSNCHHDIDDISKTRRRSRTRRRNNDERRHITNNSNRTICDISTRRPFSSLSSSTTSSHRGFHRAPFSKFSSGAGAASYQYDDDEEEELDLVEDVHELEKSHLSDMWDDEIPFEDDMDWDNDDDSPAPSPPSPPPTSSPEIPQSPSSSESPSSPSPWDTITPTHHPTLATLLSTFSPSHPPPTTNPTALQFWFECQSQQDSLARLSQTHTSALSRHDYTSLTPVQRTILTWHDSFSSAIETEQREYLIDARGKKDRQGYGAHLCLLQPEKLAVIASHEAVNMCLMCGGIGARLSRLASQIGESVEAEVNVQRLLYNQSQKHRRSAGETTDDKTKDGTSGWTYAPSHLARFVAEATKNHPERKTTLRINYANRRARRLLENPEEWSDSTKAKVGVALLSLLIDNAMIEKNRRGTHRIPAFSYSKKWISWNKLVGHVTVCDDFYRMVMNDKYKSLAPYSTRHKPMIIPPKPWTGLNRGGYHLLHANLMRTKGCRMQNDALREADLDVVLTGLNALGKVPWKINKPILSVAQQCWDDGVVLGDIPPRKDYDVPHPPERPDMPMSDLFSNRESPEFKHHLEEFLRYREGMIKHRRMYQRNMDLRSLRCSTLLKLDQAATFEDFEEIYFPYNLDFRGRAYPVPPHLSNVGSDLCRGLLTFAHPKPLGEKGLYWLKVHLANLAGMDKMSFDDRCKFSEEHMEHILASAEHPMANNNTTSNRNNKPQKLQPPKSSLDTTLSSWWQTADDPFQALATCIEISNALKTGDPPSHLSSLPVHMDGSCNGLQHYAALGRDTIGGRAVNLLNSDGPQDVYSGVMVEVIRRVAEEALKSDEEWDGMTKEEVAAVRRVKAAKLVDGLIDRGVVKRTVMTSVYGVTYIGARKQIQEKIEEKLEAQGHDIDDLSSEIHAASSYLATVTMDVMGDLFSGARQTMNWLATCARLITSQNHPVSWISPIGVPVVQPYRQTKSFTITTLLQMMVLTTNADTLPIHKQRQVTAFPPNYVHSLDSSHMLLTALEMEKRHLTFSAVHDSFWTHACDVEEMNGVLRETFVDLYDRPLLEELKRTWELRYPGLVFPELPKRGDLDLEMVKESTYFFQ